MSILASMGDVNTSATGKADKPAQLQKAVSK